MKNNNTDYGVSPHFVASVPLKVKEMMLYQYMPIKMCNSGLVKVDARLEFLESFLHKVQEDFTREFGVDRYFEEYMYLTIKHSFQSTGCPHNRAGWHSDGFMTDDINYIWYDKCPTLFSMARFDLTMDDSISLDEMEEQAKGSVTRVYPNNSLIRLDQYNIHRVGDIRKEEFRSFIKVSFSKDKYNLAGNTHNYLFDYDWKMYSREKVRNIPQFKQKDSFKTLGT